MPAYRKALRICITAGAAIGCLVLGSAISRSFSPAHNVHDVTTFARTIEEEALNELHVLEDDAKWAEHKVADRLYGSQAAATTPAVPKPPLAVPAVPLPAPPLPTPPPVPPVDGPCELLHATHRPAYALFCENIRLSTPHQSDAATKSNCPYFGQATATVWSDIWARGVELLDAPTLAEMLDTSTAIYPMAGDESKGEPRLYQLWAPAGDAGAKLIVQEHGHTGGSGHGRDEYALSDRVIDKGQLMVDIGSNLGAVSIRLSAKSPEGHVVMVEASPMTYIYQQINLHCNLPPSRFEAPADGRVAPNVISVFGAMSDQDSGTLTFTWNPKQTHTT